MLKMKKCACSEACSADIAAAPASLQNAEKYGSIDSGGRGSGRGAHDHGHEHDHDHCPGHDHAHSHGDGNPAGELAVIISSAAVFAAVLIFEGKIAGFLGPWGVRAGYAIPYLLCGLPILWTALAGIMRGAILTEFTLMGGSTIAAIALGEFPEAVGVMLFYRIGEFLQERASAGSRRSISALLASKPDRARVLVNNAYVEMNVEDVLVGQTIQVRPGEKIPLDGVIIDGSSQVDQSPMTGESVPVILGPGEAVLGGSINNTGLLTVSVASLFSDSHMARILDMMEKALASKSPTERFITRFARYYTPAVFGLAVLVALTPPLLFSQPFSAWVYRALVLLVVSCPCALLVSIPLGYFAGLGQASRKGILVKGSNVLDGLMKIDSVVFDKTGTLTKGVFDVAEIAPAAGISAGDLLKAAVLAESSSNHPVARSIMAHAAKQGLSTPAPGQVLLDEISGQGVAASCGGSIILAGKKALLEKNGIACHEPEDMPGTVVHIAKDGVYLGRISVADSTRPESAPAVSLLKRSGLKTFMLTGDRESAAARVAREVGLDGWRAGLLPEEKVEALQLLADKNRAAFVGDGINDAPILAISRVGIAMGGIGSQAAIEAADAVILNDSPAQVPVLFNLAQNVRAVIWQNIVLALGIKIAVMILGVTGLSGLWEAVFADVGVALLAVLNAMRILRK